MFQISTLVMATLSYILQCRNIELKNIEHFKNWQVYFVLDTPSLYMILSHL